MPPNRVGFSEIVLQVFLSFLPEYVEINFSYSVTYHCSGIYLLGCSSNDAIYDVLSVETGIGGCGWTISDRAVYMDVYFCQFQKNLPIHIHWLMP